MTNTRGENKRDGNEMCERGKIRVETKRYRFLRRKKARCVLFNASIFILQSLFQVEKALPKTDEEGNFFYGKIKFTAT